MGEKLLIFAPMKEYQAVMHRLTRHTREDEDALTDLLNERRRSGWEPAMMSQDEQRLTLIFQRETTPTILTAFAPADVLHTRTAFLR